MTATYHLDVIGLLGTAIERVDICFELMMLYCRAVDVVLGYLKPKEISRLPSRAAAEDKNISATLDFSDSSMGSQYQV